MWMFPLSPPDAIAPSSLTERELTIQLCPVMLCRNLPSGQSHFLRLSGDADTNVYSRGCTAIARTAFLWLVSTAEARPATKSQQRIVESIEPVITCGSSAWVA